MNKIVVRYRDGRVLKGFTSDFFPTKDVFHLATSNAPGGKTIEVRVADLKALFFVKDFAGDPTRNDVKAFDPARPQAGRKVTVTFSDGEVLVGTTQGYDPARAGFFVVPADPGSNNDRCFVVTAAVKGVKFG